MIRWIISSTEKTVPCGPFLQGSVLIFEAFLPKRAVRELHQRAPRRTPQRQKGLTLTLTKQALKGLVPVLY
jgi:hypothetical protein